MKDDGLFEMAHTRAEYPNQRARMEECARLGICPFCWENLAEWHDHPVIVKGNFWAITRNDHPYPGARYHFLAIYKEHIPSLTEMEIEAGAELFTLFHRLCQDKEISGATIFMRFGDMKFNGATVYHLHAHIISGVSRDEIAEPDDQKNWLTVKAGYKVP